MATAKERKEEAQALGFTNDHDVLKAYGSAVGATHSAICVSYTPANNGRGGRSAHWQVWSPFFKTDDPNGYWRDHGSKTFMVYSRDTKQAALEEALAWAEFKYGVTEWKKTNRLFTTGTYFPAEVIDWLESYVKGMTEWKNEA